MGNANIVASVLLGTCILLILFITWFKLKTRRLGKYGILTGLFSLSFLALPLWELLLVEHKWTAKIEQSDYEIQLARTGTPFSAPQFNNPPIENQSSLTIESSRKADIELWAHLFGIEYDTMKDILAMVD